MRNIVVSVEEMPLIRSGRNFVVQGAGELMPIVQPPRLPPLVREETPVEDVRVAGPEMSLFCPACGRLLKRQLFEHNVCWMAELHYCTKHAVPVWVDIYLKGQVPNTRIDYQNAWASDDERRRLKSEYVLTPTGIRKAA